MNEPNHTHLDVSNPAESAKKLVEDIISFFGVNIDVSAKLEGDVIYIFVASSSINSLLIGRNADTLRSIQLLVSSILRSKGAGITRVSVDIADYKRQHDEKLAARAREWIEEVRRTGNSLSLIHI